MGLVHEIRLLDIPVGIGNPVLGGIDPEAEFQDAADFNGGQGKDNRIDLVVLDLDIHEIGGFGGERNDSSVGVNGAALNVADTVEIMEVGSADGGEFLPLLREHLDALVVVVDVLVIVGDVFAIKINRGGSGCFGVGGHLQLFLRGLLELGAQKGRRCTGQEHERATNPGSTPHCGVSRERTRNPERCGHHFPFVSAARVSTTCC